MSKLTLICGLARAGKTTYAKQFSERVVSWDTCGQPQGRTRRCNAAAASTDGDVVVEGLYLTAAERISLVEACKGRYKVCIWIDTPVEECIRRGRSKGAYVEKLIKGYASKFEPPTSAEGWDEVIRIEG